MFIPKETHFHSPNILNENFSFFKHSDIHVSHGSPLPLPIPHLTEEKATGHTSETETPKGRLSDQFSFIKHRPVRHLLTSSSVDLNRVWPGLHFLRTQLSFTFFSPFLIDSCVSYHHHVALNFLIRKSLLYLKAHFQCVNRKRYAGARSCKYDGG